MLNYTNHAICFIDILGFKKEVLNSATTDSEAHQRINNFISIIPNAIEEIIKNQPKLKSTILSDSILLSIPTDDSSTIETKISDLCSVSAKIQVKLFQKRLWSRGAITHGLLHHDNIKNIIVGPGLVEAYELERHHANFPRIIISPSLISTLGGEKETVNKLNKDQKNIFVPERSNRKQIDNDFLFLDYFQFLKEEIKAPNHWDYYLFILKESLYLDPKYMAKHKWTLSYLKESNIRYGLQSKMSKHDTDSQIYLRIQLDGF